MIIKEILIKYATILCPQHEAINMLLHVMITNNDIDKILIDILRIYSSKPIYNFRYGCMFFKYNHIPIYKRIQYLNNLDSKLLKNHTDIDIQCHIEMYKAAVTYYTCHPVYKKISYGTVI
jgi:hypothetical protein